MAYNEKLANMTRELIAQTHKNVEEKAMFGGLCFMVNDKMCVGVEKERLMVRLDPAKYDEVMGKEGCKPMDFTGKVMKGFVFVDADTLTTKSTDIYLKDARTQRHIQNTQETTLPKNIQLASKQNESVYYIKKIIKQNRYIA